MILFLTRITQQGLTVGESAVLAAASIVEADKYLVGDFPESCLLNYCVDVCMRRTNSRSNGNSHTYYYIIPIAY